MLDFTTQQGAGEGLLVTSDMSPARFRAPRNPKGDGHQVQGAGQHHYHRIRRDLDRRAEGEKRGIWHLSGRKHRGAGEPFGRFGRIGRRDLRRPVVKDHREEFGRHR